MTGEKRIADGGWRIGKIATVVAPLRFTDMYRSAPPFVMRGGGSVGAGAQRTSDYPLSAIRYPLPVFS